LPLVLCGSKKNIVFNMEKTGKWELSKEEFERCKKEAVEKTVEKFFPDIEGKEKVGLCRFLLDITGLLYKFVI